MHRSMPVLTVLIFLTICVISPSVLTPKEVLNQANIGSCQGFPQISMLRIMVRDCAYSVDLRADRLVRILYPVLAQEKESILQFLLMLVFVFQFIHNTRNIWIEMKLDNSEFIS